MAGDRRVSWLVMLHGTTGTHREPRQGIPVVRRELNLCRQWLLAETSVADQRRIAGASKRATFRKTDIDAQPPVLNLEGP